MRKLRQSVAVLLVAGAMLCVNACGMAGAPEKPAGEHPNAQKDTRPRGGEF